MKIISNFRNKLAAVAATATVALASAPAFAASAIDPTAVTGELDKTVLATIGVALLALSGVIAMIRAGRKAAGG